MLHIFSMNYRGMPISVSTYRHTDGTKKIISIGGWDLDKIPPMMLAKAERHIKNAAEYSVPQTNSSSWN